MNGYIATNMTFYAVTYEELRKAAYEKGYALTLHGSLQRDLDVVAIPWTEEAVDAETLVKALTEASGGFVLDTCEGRDPTLKPHGRLGWSIHLGGPAGRYVDLSVMPLQPAKQPAKEPAMYEVEVSSEPTKPVTPSGSPTCQITGHDKH